MQLEEALAHDDVSALLLLSEILIPLEELLPGPELLMLHAAAKSFLPRKLRLEEELVSQVCGAFERCDAHRILSALRQGAMPEQCLAADGKSALQTLLQGDHCAALPPNMSPTARRSAARVLMAKGKAPQFADAAVEALSQAVLDGKCNTIRFLAEARADINQQDPAQEYSTPLMLALSSPTLAPHTRMDVVEEILGLNADARVRRKSDGRNARDILMVSHRSTRSWRRLEELLLPYLDYAFEGNGPALV
eukprot:TRINITY_DN74134_c0_g1_i1.p1 TRINITY_DN74134_c0_g1~~TRINITY_DN74134_c0_g1_i1.p1  ORF type:complete len:250 (+),score=48.95 TRINITY_DN74134_c0_g1_i1:46-795(+)